MRGSVETLRKAAKSACCCSLELVGRRGEIISVGIWPHSHAGFIRKCRFKSQNVADPPRGVLICCRFLQMSARLRKFVIVRQVSVFRGE